MLEKLESCQALVLNADFQPLSYSPLSLWNWQEAVKAVFLDKVNVVSEYDVVAHSASVDITLPSVVALKNIAPMERWATFTRFNVFLRDHFTCQYCEIRKPVNELTFDHVIPRSRGGSTVWRNVVSACKVCNFKKGNRTPKEVGFSLKNNPAVPTVRSLQQSGKFFVSNYLHESWRDFL